MLNCLYQLSRNQNPLEIHFSIKNWQFSNPKQRKESKIGEQLILSTSARFFQSKIVRIMLDKAINSILSYFFFPQLCCWIIVQMLISFQIQYQLKVNMSESKLTKLSFLILGLASFGLTDRIQNNLQISDLGVASHKFSQEVKQPSIKHKVNKKQKFQIDNQVQKPIHKLFQADYPASKVGARLEPKKRANVLYKLSQDNSQKNQPQAKQGNDGIEINMQQLFDKDLVNEIREKVKQIYSQQAQTDLTHLKSTLGESRMNEIIKLWQEATPEQRTAGLDMIKSRTKKQSQDQGQNKDMKQPIEVSKQRRYY